MTGVAMTVTLFDAPLRNAVAGMRAFPEHMTPFLDAVGAAMESKTIRRFDEQKGPDGSAWLPSKRAAKEGGKTLVLSGRLRLSQTYNVIGNDTVEWGTNLIYAAIHQFGGTIRSYARGQETFHKRDRDGSLKPGFVKKGMSDFARGVTLPQYDIHMPARPFVGIDAEDLKEIEATAERHLGAAILGKSPGEP